MTLPITTTTKDKDIGSFVKEFKVSECNWQLFDDDLANPDKAVETIQKSGLDVVSLHTPFASGWEAPLIENYTKDPSQARMLITAEYIANKLGKKLPIVFHTRMHEQEFSYIQGIAASLTKTLEYCPHLELLLENCGFYHDLDADLSKIPNQVPTIVKMFNDFMPNTPIGSCLDICHTNIVNRVGNLLRKEGICDSAVPSTPDFILAFGEDCKLVHLANCRQYGIGKGNHGTGFYKEDFDTLRSYILRIGDCLPNAKIVLEVSELDYSNRIELRETLLTLQGIS